MSRGTAIAWKIVYTRFDRETHQFTKDSRRLGTYTMYTAHGHMARKHPGWTYKAVPFHGSGGYWVAADGTTAEMLPA